MLASHPTHLISIGKTKCRRKQSGDIREVIYGILARRHAFGRAIMARGFLPYRH
ncbi:hypothetical protein SXCC_00792 [Gluconacetobacter sp. SXCC-1]|nr:hypothetical protein SXCC_00792 [Gluconacetobacter sp. SXCC-1]